MDDYPVSGISWYEAAVYAEYAGKSLPTAYHWGSGAGFFYDPIWYLFGSRVIPNSNFNRKGAEQAGKYKGINCFGAYDMAGNVREWCWNETSSGRAVCGGAWNTQRITFNAAYGNERMVAYLYLPKNARPTYQTIIYFPGSGYLF